MFALQKKGLHVMKNVCVNQKGLRVIKMFAQTKKCSCIRKNVCASGKLFTLQEKCWRKPKKVRVS
jgi:uncharacterized Fe-S cluster protein YjdI